MSNRLYVGNLAFQTTEDALQRAFEQCGEVSEVKLILDRDTGRSRGFAFVAMATPDAARKAIESLDGTELDGRPLRVNEAQEKTERSGGFGGGGGRRPRGDFRSGGGGGGGRGGRSSSDRRGGGGGGGGRW